MCVLFVGDSQGYRWSSGEAVEGPYWLAAAGLGGRTQTVETESETESMKLKPLLLFRSRYLSIGQQL